MLTEIHCRCTKTTSINPRPSHYTDGSVQALGSSSSCCASFSPKAGTLVSFAPRNHMSIANLVIQSHTPSVSTSSTSSSPSSSPNSIPDSKPMTSRRVDHPDCHQIRMMSFAHSSVVCQNSSSGIVPPEPLLSALSAPGLRSLISQCSGQSWWFTGLCCSC